MGGQQSRTILPIHEREAGGNGQIVPRRAYNFWRTESAEDVGGGAVNVLRFNALFGPKTEEEEVLSVDALVRRQG